MALTVKKLDKIQKSLTSVYEGDPETLAGIVMKLDGARAAVTAGQTITKSELEEILGEVEITPIGKSAPTPAPEPEGELIHPLQPLTLDLFKSLVDEQGAIRKGIVGPRMQEIFEDFFQKAAKQFDDGLEQAVEATAVELGAIGAIGKADENEGTMDNFLKSEAGMTLVRKLGDMDKELKLLRNERDTTFFTKQATDIGEGDGFAEDLKKLHQADPALAERIKKRLGSKNELLRKSDVWGREIGAGGGPSDASSAVARMNAFAKERVEKGEKDANGKRLTFAKAFTQVCSEQPDLYAEYQAETRR